MKLLGGARDIRHRARALSPRAPIPSLIGIRVSAPRFPGLARLGESAAALSRLLAISILFCCVSCADRTVLSAAQVTLQYVRKVPTPDAASVPTHMMLELYGNTVEQAWSALLVSVSQ